MKTLLVPLVIALMGAGLGVGVGVALYQPPAVEEAEAGAETVETASYEELDPVEEASKRADSEYFELSRKLIVPVVDPDGERSFVAIELHLELAEGGADKAAVHEPKIRDALLRTVIAFAHTGAFDDGAHPNETFEELARELKRSARRVLGDGVRSVLIGDLIKQDA